jgi:hypothetical protein
MRESARAQYTPACRHSSAAHNEARRQADARPISVHAEERNGFKINNLARPVGLHSGMDHRKWPQDVSPGVICMGGVEPQVEVKPTRRL